MARQIWVPLKTRQCYDTLYSNLQDGNTDPNARLVRYNSNLFLQLFQSSLERVDCAVVRGVVPSFGSCYSK